VRCIGPGFSEAEAFSKIVQAKGVGEGGAVAPSACGMVRLDDLVEDPASDEESKDAIFVGETDKDSKDDKVYQALGILSVVHGAYARDEAEKSGEAGIGFALKRRRRDGARNGVIHAAFGTGIGIGTRWGRSGSGKFSGQAGFAEDCSSNGAGALLAERLAAVLAESNSFTFRMVGAVHTSPPSCMCFEILGENTTKACVAQGEAP
jgi:hypothetical protein